MYTPSLQISHEREAAVNMSAALQSEAQSVEARRATLERLREEADLSRDQWAEARARLEQRLASGLTELDQVWSIT